MVTSASRGGAGTEVSIFAGNLTDTRSSPPFAVSDLICEYGACVDSEYFAAMLMNGDNASILDVPLWINFNTAKGNSKKRWCQ